MSKVIVRQFLLIVLFTSIIISIFSQELPRLISFDQITGKVDTLDPVFYDPYIVREQTNFYIGSFDSDINDLDEEFPRENTYDKSKYSVRKKVNVDYDINKFPIRTSIKLFGYENDTLRDKCSGSMISRNHVLTAAHCIADFENCMLYDSLFVCPVFDNGEQSINFDCSWVSKVYMFENWQQNDSDFAILELEKPLGDITGWIGFGFNSLISEQSGDIFYKFTYPVFDQVSENNVYNGDTLYYCYGPVDLVYNDYLGIQNTFGLRGESGSSLIKVNKDKDYTTFGVATFGSNFMHTRITNWKFYAMKSIVNKNSDISYVNNEDPEIFYISPNPTSGSVKIKGDSDNMWSSVVKLDLFNSNGQKIMEEFNENGDMELDLSSLPNGLYLLFIYTDNSKLIKKIVKYRA